MRWCIFVFALASAVACNADKPIRARSTQVSREHMLELRLLDRDRKELQQILAKFNADQEDYWKRMKTTYGVDQEAGDRIDAGTGTIVWHHEQQRVPPPTKHP